jgi:REP element-mobilizing transposase RayT
VFTRGLNREPIFRDEDDRQDLYSRMRFLARTTDFRVLAWSLLPNHFHLLTVSGGSTLLSSFMRRTLTGYSLHFNEKYGRVGYLFQGRFGSRLLLGRGSMKRAMSYVSANPIKHGICRGLRELEVFRWSSHREILERPESSLADLAQAMQLFDGGVDGYTRDIEHFRFDAVADFVPRAEECHPSPTDSSREMEDRLADLLEKTAADSGVDISALRGKGRCYRLSETRRRFVVLAVNHLGASASRTALHLGISPQRVSRILIEAGTTAPEKASDS